MRPCSSIILIAARRKAVESYQTLRILHVPQSPVLKEAHDRLVSLYAAWGKVSEAGRHNE
jgi:hypothetical protein